MQLDKTRIVVRERGVFDTLDLGLRVFRIYFVPISVTLFIGALPWIALNYFLTGWMLATDFDSPDSPEYVATLIRFAWTMLVLVGIEAPMASVFSTVYLGQALFVEQPRIRNAFRDVFSMLPRLIWFHCFLRGIVPAIWLVLVIDSTASFSDMEVFLIFLFIAVMVRQAMAPFLNEIILLERNPISSKDARVMTIRRRSSMLHGPASGNVIFSAMIVGAYAILLAAGLACVLYFAQMILFDDMQLHRGMVLIGWPLALWMTVAFVTVVRFLFYLDLRIRQEGWEVELRIRAEASRLAETLQ